MKIISENDMRSETGGCDSWMSTEASAPRSYFRSSKVEILLMKILQQCFFSPYLSFINV